MTDLVPFTEYGPTKDRNFEFSWQGFGLEVQLMSNVGKKRKNNEDSCIMCAPDDAFLVSERGLLFAVADGMGGASAGEYASRMALQTVVNKYYNGPINTIPVALREAVTAANERI